MMKLMKNNYSGKLLAFEGTDGAGKSTLLSMTEKFLHDKYGKENVISIKQPTELSRNSRLFQKMIYCPDNGKIDYEQCSFSLCQDSCSIVTRLYCRR